MEPNSEKITTEMNGMTGSQGIRMTQLLLDWSAGDEQALEKLTPIVYKELYRLAKHYMRLERQGHVLQVTALVNEAYIRLIDWKNVRWRNRAHFYGVAAQMMRRVLVDYAKSRNSLKRSGPYPHDGIEKIAIVSKHVGDDLLALDEALNRMANDYPRPARVVELRHFGGLGVNETAVVLKISPETVLRDWCFALTWLKRELTGENSYVASRNSRALSSGR